MGLREEAGRGAAFCTGTLAPARPRRLETSGHVCRPRKGSGVAAATEVRRAIWEGSGPQRCTQGLASVFILQQVGSAESCG